MKVLYIYTMYIHFTYLPPTSSSLVSLNSPPSSFKSFLFFLHLLSITAWSNQRTCGCSLGHEQPTSAHITEREWVSLLQQSSISASGSSVGGGTLWDPPHPCWNLNWLNCMLACAGNRAAESWCMQQPRHVQKSMFSSCLPTHQLLLDFHPALCEDPWALGGGGW